MTTSPLHTTTEPDVIIILSTFLHYLQHLHLTVLTNPLRYTYHFPSLFCYYYGPKLYTPYHDYPVKDSTPGDPLVTRRYRLSSQNRHLSNSTDNLQGPSTVHPSTPIPTSMSKSTIFVSLLREMLVPWATLVNSFHLTDFSLPPGLVSEVCEDENTVHVSFSVIRPPFIPLILKDLRSPFIVKFSLCFHL